MSKVYEYRFTFPQIEFTKEEFLIIFGGVIPIETFIRIVFITIEFSW